MDKTRIEPPTHTKSKQQKQNRRETNQHQLKIRENKKQSQQNYKREN